jgi:hypothetical protein
MDTPQDGLTDVLRRMNEAYIFKVNQAVEHDRWDLVQELTDDYFADVQSLISASGSQ